MDNNDNDYQRPRRPNPETIAYLKSLPLAVELANDEITRFINQESSEYPSLLAASLSAVEEIRHEIASLAGDEEASQILEAMAHITLPYSETATRVMFAGLSGYHMHLSTHRYGSHVVQTILQLGTVCASKEDLALNDDAPQMSRENLPLLEDLIHGMVDELSPTASHLAVHVCGSHVLRSLLCFLGGVNFKQEKYTARRGKEKSKKKGKKKDVESDNSHRNGHAGMVELIYQTKDSRFKTNFHDTLQQIVESIWNEDKNMRLQEMACHPSAGPLLMLSLRVLSYAHCSQKQEWQETNLNEAKDKFRLGIIDRQPKFELDSPAHNLTKRILMLDFDDKVGDVIYGLSGEPRGSHVLETLMYISPDEVYSQIFYKGGFNTSLVEYAEHDVSNFVVQALLSTVRSKDQAELLLQGVEKLVTNGFVVDPTNKRIGILWRATELAANFHIHQESLVKAIRIGCGLLVKSPVEESVEYEERKKKKPRQKASSIPLQDCIPYLLDLKEPMRDGDRVTLGVEGTRAVFHLLRFSPRLSGEVLEGLTEKMSQYELELLAKDGLGSRCVWDGILDKKAEMPFLKAAKRLLLKLSGRWGALASHRVGHHCVIKLFRFLHTEEKAILTSELTQMFNRLEGSAMGRSVIKACALDAFLESEKTWRSVIEKMQKKEVFLTEILEDGCKKKKRKRKRKLMDESDSKKPIVSAVDAISSIISEVNNN
mmetsp:Transcript_20296/g.30524  ORF Transcript_20296/g.30524 Transcript_20296/m.30524 type:complete len:712 (+) Transcript_20296:50-2185(+)